MNDSVTPRGLPQPQGLYDPAREHDACGIGFVANIKGQKTHDIITKGIQLLINLTHRGACGCDPETGTRKYHNKTIRGSFREAHSRRTVPTPAI